MTTITTTTTTTTTARPLAPLLLPCLLTGLGALACRVQPGTPPTEPSRDAIATIRAEDLARHVEILASDGFAGRFPGSAGEAKTLTYLAATMAAHGVEPASESGYLQPVALASTTIDPRSGLTIHGSEAPIELRHGRELILGARGGGATLSLDTDGVVFAGYGIVAPEYGWDDYGTVDLRGKTVLVLGGDPGPTRDDPDFFKGRALTHYGTHQAKAELARERGATAVFAIHDSDATGLGWQLIADNSQRKKLQLADDPQRGGVHLAGLVPVETARTLLGQGGLDYDDLVDAAGRDGFRARSGPLDGNYAITREIEAVESHNLVAWIPGSTRPNEYVVYTAHWDHVGVAPPQPGQGDSEDRVFNGAVDNATGTAALLELAEAFASLDEPPARSVVFIATTAEEQGLLGAFHYTAHPTFPLADTVAVINMDALFPFGETKGMTVVALGSSELEEYLADAAAAVGRRLYPDPSPEFGAFFRSDHYPFVARGVPALFAVGGPAQDPSVGETVDIARYVEYVTQHYHQVSDEYDPARWDMAGIVQDVEVYFRAGLAIANDPRVPNWYPSSEFRPLRDAMRPPADG